MYVGQAYDRMRTIAFECDCECVLSREQRGCSLGVKRQIRKCHGSVNVLIRNFSNCSHDVKIQLFRTYCINMYCTQFWSNALVMERNKLRTTYTNCFRRFMNYHYRCSASVIIVLNNVISWPELQRKVMWQFMNRILASANTIIQSLVHSSIPLGSKMWRHWFSTQFMSVENMSVEFMSVYVSLCQFMSVE